MVENAGTVILATNHVNALRIKTYAVLVDQSHTGRLAAGKQEDSDMEEAAMEHAVVGPPVTRVAWTNQQGTSAHHTQAERAHD